MVRYLAALHGYLALVYTAGLAVVKSVIRVIDGVCGSSLTQCQRYLERLAPRASIHACAPTPFTPAVGEEKDPGRPDLLCVGKQNH